MATAPGERPRLVVVYGHRSLDAMSLRGGARGWCDLLWLVDRDDPSVAAVRPLLERSGPVVDRLAEAPAEVARELRRHAPDGLATFYDTGMEHVAEIAAELGLEFNPPAAGRALEDKLAQREALAAAGLPGPRVVALPAGAPAAEVRALGARIGWPAVLKPRRASGSWHTLPVASPDELATVWEELSALGGDHGEPGGGEEMVLEEYLPDGPPMPGGFEADYVSVETVASGGRYHHLAVTGRFPLVAPFRETGFFIPSTLGDRDASAVIELASQALRALGVSSGCAHTEIKLTSAGPRVIEVNGRIGGGVPEMLRLATGVDLIRLAMEAAVGRADELAAPPPARGVAYRFFHQPPVSAARLVRIDGLEELGRRPGVDSLFLHYPPGTEIDARDGTRTYVFAVVGLAADHAGVVAVDAFIRSEVEAVYDHRQ
jgi:biotin carboxylase